MKKKVVYVISDIDKALAFEWIAKGLRSKFELSFILIGNDGSELSAFLRQHQILYHEVNDVKYPTTIRKWMALFLLLRSIKPDVVHTHLWRANVLGLTASWILRIRQRVYTRHHATTHYKEYPSGRKWDLLCNFLATDIIAISKSIEEILVKWDGANPNKIKLIHHGFDFTYFSSSQEQKVSELYKKYNLTAENYPIIGVISRYVEWKGIQFIIPAFKRLRDHFPNAKLLLANANGEYGNRIKDQLRELPADSFQEIPFEKDLVNLYRLFNVFVHVPIDPYAEAFGQTYVEPLIVGVPSVFTLSGIAREFVRHKENAWVVDFQNSAQIEEGIRTIISQKDFREALIRNGKSAVQRFSINEYLGQLENLYLNG